MSRSILYKIYDKAIPKEICEHILREGDALNRAEATVSVSNEKGYDVNETMRKTEVAFWDEEHWINGLVTHYIAMANRDIWQFDVIVSQGIQYGVYGESGFYDWHKDEFEWPFADDHDRIEWRGLNRKLSATVNLVDEGDYEGGHLQFKDAWGNISDIPESRNQGTVTVFPSSVLHTVTPVTRGVRKSLVSWILGPQLR